MPSHLTISQARSFQLHALGLVEPFANVALALQHLGFVQMDPINVCGRMHDLILRNRVRHYREGDLLAHLYAPAPPENRLAFEHYLPGQGILVALPAEAWPHLLHQMEYRRSCRGRYGGRLTRAEEKIAGIILQELAVRGPLSSDEIEHDGNARSAWGSTVRTVKKVLDTLLLHGRVLIVNRRRFRRVYDLPQKVLPREILVQTMPGAEETRRWLIVQRLKQRRLVALRRSELGLVDGLVEPVQVAGLPTLYCLRADCPLLELACTTPDLNANPKLLAPLDPLIYDRKLTAQLWDFSYTWEVYTPCSRRVRGYYALPLLAGSELVGHVDPKADRDRSRLNVVGRRVRRGHRVAPAVRELAAFLGLNRVPVRGPGSGTGNAAPVTVARSRKASRNFRPQR